MTVSSWLGKGRRWWARTAEPRKSEPKITPIQVRVAAAFLDSGERKAGTPLEIASTPVSATAPEEKPLRMRKSPREPPALRAATERAGSNGIGARWPNSARAKP